MRAQQIGQGRRMPEQVPVLPEKFPKDSEQKDAV